MLQPPSGAVSLQLGHALPAELRRRESRRLCESRRAPVLLCAHGRHGRGSRSAQEEENLLRLSRHQGAFWSPVGGLRAALHGALTLARLQATRDECVTLHGELALLLPWQRTVLASQLRVPAGPEARECRRLIEAHKACLRSEGFDVSPAALSALSATGLSCQGPVFTGCDVQV